MWNNSSLGWGSLEVVIGLSEGVLEEASISSVCSMLGWCFAAYKASIQDTIVQHSRSDRSRSRSKQGSRIPRPGN